MDPQSMNGNPNGKLFDFTSASRHVSNPEPLTPRVRVAPEYLPGGRKSLPAIATHAFGLGIALGVCTVFAIELAYFNQYIWRLPFFIAVLSVFHYLEFDMTARYNPSDAKVSSFLLFSNGRAYNIAHTTAMVEMLVRTWLCSEYYGVEWLRLPRPFCVPMLPPWVPVTAGMILVVSGQLMRSLAMKQAGTNFNHIVQSTKKEDHVLVTTGVYAISRHPSYFGFFWWGLGTQLVLGNYLCLVAYGVILWKFFSHRIYHEEKHLIEFFDESYLNYRKRTPVLIPFIR